MAEYSAPCTCRRRGPVSPSPGSSRTKALSKCSALKAGCVKIASTVVTVREGGNARLVLCQSLGRINSHSTPTTNVILRAMRSMLRAALVGGVALAAAAPAPAVDVALDVTFKLTDLDYKPLAGVPAG